MSEKRFTIAIYDDKAINGFAVLDLQKPNDALRLKYENVYIGSKEGCEIVCKFGNSLAEGLNELNEENEQLKQQIEIEKKWQLEKDRHYVKIKEENEQLRKELKELNILLFQKQQTKD